MPLVPSFVLSHEQKHGKLGRECVLALTDLDLLFNSISLFFGDFELEFSQ